VSPKNLALSAAAIAVAGMAVYLFVQVKASPAQAQEATTTTARPSHAPERSVTPPPVAPTPTPAPTRVTATPAPTPVAQAGRPPAPEVAVVDEPSQRPNLKLDSMMELANKAYDSQDFDQATAIAGKVLSKDPTNVRMLRIMVSSNCIAGDSVVAQQHYERLPKFDREQMKARCDRYGVSFKDPPE
jgi:hypothetical protein